MQTIRVALISGSPLVLAGLRAGLGEESDLELVCAAANIEQARTQVFGAADVVVVDPADEPQGLAAEVRSAGPSLVLLSDDISRAAEWLEVGASLVSPSEGSRRIAGAIRAAFVGLSAVSPALLIEALRLATSANAAQGGRLLDALTARERTVLAKMAQGLANRQIATELGISTHTAKFHVAQIMGKLNATSRAHAVGKALSSAAGAFEGRQTG